MKCFIQLVLTLGLILLSIACGGGGGGGEGGVSTDTGGSVQSAVDISAPTDASSSEFKLLYQIAFNVIFPAYQTLFNQFNNLDANVAAFCAGPSSATLGAVRNAWRAAVDSWMRITTIEFGPIGRDNGELRIFFFPDSNNNVQRSVDRVLAGSNELNGISIASESVAAQGLTALEVLLFSADPVAELAAQPRRCELATAITANIRRIVELTVVEWDPNGAGFVTVLAGAGQGSTRFPTEQFALEELINEFAGIASLIRIQKLSSPLGSSAGTAQVSLFESFRSGTSGRNIAQNIAGLRQLYLGGTGFGFDDLLVERDRTDLDTRIKNGMNAVEDLANTLGSSLEQAAAGGSRGQAEQLAAAAADLSRLISNDLASEFNVTISFNENDGD